MKERNGKHRAPTLTLTWWVVAGVAAVAYCWALLRMDVSASLSDQVDVFMAASLASGLFGWLLRWQDVTQ